MMVMVVEGWCEILNCELVDVIDGKEIEIPQRVTDRKKVRKSTNPK